MADNLKGIPFSSDDEGRSYPDLAKSIVYEQACSLGVLSEHPTFSVDEVYVVWFAYVLGGWKALVSTTVNDGMYYEVTYDRVNERTYLDAYKKWENVCIPDGEVLHKFTN